MTPLTVSQFVKGNNNVTFHHYRQKILYYLVRNDTNKIFSFPVPIEDLEGATVHASEKALTMMRYIRKAIAEGTLIEHEE